MSILLGRRRTSSTYPRHQIMDSGKLTEADFENIWLRVKDRSIKLVFGLVGAVGLGGVAAGYQWAKTTLDTHVEQHLEQYLKGDSFKGLVGNALATGTVELRSERVAAEKTIHELQQRAKILKDSGILVEDNLISLAGHDGRPFQLERGTLARDGNVQFSKPYPKPPIVLVDASYDVFAPQRDLQRRRAELAGHQVVPTTFVVVAATETGFSLKARYIRPGVSWIAIGW